MVGQLHGVGVLGLLEVLVSVSAHVPPAADVPTDQADPKVLSREQKVLYIQRCRVVRTRDLTGVGC